MPLPFLTVLPDFLAGVVLSITETLFPSILAAIIAYGLWAWLHSPHLIISGSGRVPIVDATNGNTRYSHRFKIENIGTKAAKNCEGTLSMRIPKEERVIRSQTPTHWLTTKDDLIVNDEKQRYQTTIPAGGSQKLEVFRQERNKNLKPNVVSGGRRFVETGKESKWHSSVDKPLEATFEDISKSVTNDIAKTSANLKEEDIQNADWSDARIKLIVEAESARPLSVDLDIDEDDGWVWADAKKQGWRRQIATVLYQVINRIRMGRWVVSEP